MYLGCSRTIHSPVGNQWPIKRRWWNPSRLSLERGRPGRRRDDRMCTGRWWPLGGKVLLIEVVHHQRLGQLELVVPGEYLAEAIKARPLVRLTCQRLCPEQLSMVYHGWRCPFLEICCQWEVFLENKTRRVKQLQLPKPYSRTSSWKSFREHFERWRFSGEHLWLCFDNIVTPVQPFVNSSIPSDTHQKVSMN